MILYLTFETVLCFLTCFLSLKYEDFLDARFKTMKKDSLNSSHPLSSSVRSSEQIEEMFDSLSYFKVLLVHKRTGEFQINFVCEDAALFRSF